MAVISKITTQQKNQDRFNIFTDDGSGERFAFSVDSDVLIKFQLKKGMELDEFSLFEIQYQDDIRKAYHVAIQYLSVRMRSRKEISDYLLKKDSEEPIIQEVLHKLSTQNYINDQEFALAYARTQVNTTDKGPNVISLELKEKGIEQDFIAQALEEYPVEQQVEKAVHISGKFLQKSAKESRRIQKQKLEQLLYRKGYPFEVIAIACEEALGDKEHDDDLGAITFQGEKVHRKYAQYSGFEYEQKMKQALYRKGFSIELIEKYLSLKNKS